MFLVYRRSMSGYAVLMHVDDEAVDADFRYIQCYEETVPICIGS